MAQKPSVDPTEAFIGDGTKTIGIEKLFSNTSHLDHLGTTHSLLLTAACGAG
jgi:hypothetical protein